MGWNGIKVKKTSYVLQEELWSKYYYFVHSYAAPIEFTKNSAVNSWVLATTDYGDQEFISVVQKDNVIATQFHPEKSGSSGIALLSAFLKSTGNEFQSTAVEQNHKKTALSKRIIACLDVRSNDHGDLVVTKGDQYDVREKSSDSKKGEVRNLGKPMHLAERYFQEGADEVTFLNITSFRNCPLRDLPVLELLKKTSERVFVPLTIGGGIRDLTDSEGKKYSALEVASVYFRSGADKVSIGSDAVFAVEEYISNNKNLKGTSSIEQIAKVYGAQAVVISVDAKRVYVKSPSDTPHHTIKCSISGPNGEEYCWYQATVKGGREGRDIDVKQLVTGCEALGAGEILLNCIDKDGTNSGYDLEFIKDVRSYVSIPIIASSGAGKVEHFSELFETIPDVESALAAGIFHRQEVKIEEVKNHLKKRNVIVRL
eukprot:TRINITY_DN6013_c0_g1_i1.p1 TRINITY_DN6013_c0_g1~~TRINITY_DN6013_c0_g1_i1.p1  ORF type:complete len:427 (-),score=79.19 TRINITY_DN6013_c0_g1_i1:13-1293(-)